MSAREISAAAQALGRRGGRKSLGAKSKADLSAFGKAAAEKRWAAKRAEVRPHTEAPPLAQEIAAVIAPAVPSVYVAAKPKRPLPKAGTMAARVLLEIEALSAAGLAPLTSERIALHAGMVGIGNILSSLRSAGHVVSEPKPGSRREKLWRLA